MNETQKDNLAAALRILRELQYELMLDGRHEPTQARRANDVQDAIDSLETI